MRPSSSQRPVWCAAVVFAVWSGWPVAAADPFLRGDVDESGAPSVTDAVRILRFLFAGGAAPRCLDAADSDDDGRLTVSDPIFLLGSLFQGGPAPPAPFPACGPDPTEDELGCEGYAGCLPAFDFYGHLFVGDGVFFVVDRSGSMQDSGELAIAKREMIKAIEGFPAGVELGVVFFDRAVTKFPASGQPAAADDATRSAAIAFIQSVAGGSSSCVQNGLFAALGFVGASKARRSLVIYLGDGGGTCPGVDEQTYLKQTLEAVTRANAGRARISAVGVLQINPVNRRFLADLASLNGGVFIQVTR
ncbi:MAG: VWA domain-containing protein [Planctomycetes bacterium]|nr:VWA domain-containing protein [Planctomycetota bacterium]